MQNPLERLKTICNEKQQIQENDKRFDSSQRLINSNKNKINIVPNNKSLIEEKNYVLLLHQRRHSIDKSFQQLQRKTKIAQPQMTYNNKSNYLLDELYLQQKEQLKKQWLEIKSKNKKSNEKIDKSTQQRYKKNQNSKEEQNFFNQNSDLNTTKLNSENSTSNIKYARNKQYEETKPRNYDETQHNLQISTELVYKSPQLNRINYTCPVHFQTQTDDSQIQVNINNYSSLRLKDSILIPLQSKLKRKVLSSQTKSLKNDQKSVQYYNFKPKIKNQIKYSKPVMTQKISNLKKDLNKINARSESYHSQKIQKRVYNQVNKHLTSTIYYHDEKPNSSSNFPLINNEERKMSFQELFQYEKKKMENLKKILRKTNNTFDTQIKSEKSNKEINTKNQDPSTFRKLFDSRINNQSNRLMNLCQSKKSYLLYPIKDKGSLSISNNQTNFKNQSNLLMNNPQKINVDLISTSRSKIQQKISHQNPQSTNQPQQSSKKSKKQSISQITTFNFDYIQKKSVQKPEIKQLRHKYLYEQKKKFNKQEYFKQDVSVVLVHGGNQTKISNWRNKISAETFVQDFLQIQKIPAFPFKTMQKIIVQIPKQKSHKKHKTIGDEKLKQYPQDQFTFRKFEPWQNHKKDHYNMDYDICDFNK